MGLSVFATATPDKLWNAKYFVTINTKDKYEYFGEVISEEVHHSAAGKLANEYWEMIPEKFPYTKLDDLLFCRTEKSNVS